MELPILPIQDKILSTIHEENNIQNIHQKLYNLVDEYGWQYPHYLMSINFSSDKKKSNFLMDIVNFLKNNDELLKLEKMSQDNFLLLEIDDHIQVLTQEENYFVANPTTTHLLPLFLNNYTKETKGFDINQINWSINDSLNLNPFFYALHFECQYFIIDYVKNGIPFFNKSNVENLNLYEELINKKYLPNKPFIKTLFEKYKLEAMIENEVKPNRKYKV